MLLTCCCFVQKLLELQTVVGLLLGGGWLGGCWGDGACRCSWLVAHGTSQPPEKSCEQKALEPIRRAERGGGGLRGLARSITTRPEEGL